MSSSPSNRPWTSLFISSAAAVGLSVAAPIPAQAISIGELLFRGVQVIQLSSISDRQEVQIGQQMDRQIQRQGMQFHRDPVLNDYVSRVGQRLAVVSNRPNIPYTFQVVNDRNINAFATMGGFVYVTTGLLAAADNEAQLASVLSHEIGHIADRDLVKQLRQSAIARGLTSAAGLNQSAAANIGVELAFNRPRSRQDEFQADQIGLRMMSRAGYAESAAPEFMKKLLRQRSSTPSFLSTHPGVPDRINALEQTINGSTGNGCRQGGASSRCGLDTFAYRQTVHNRLGVRSSSPQNYFRVLR